MQLGVAPHARRRQSCDAANIAFNLALSLGDGLSIGPILMQRKMVFVDPQRRVPFG